MSKLLTLSSLILLVFLFSCKKDESTILEPSDTFVKYYGDTYSNEAYQMINTSDGGFIMAGKTENSAEKKSMFVVKVAANGNEEWSKSYSNAKDEEAKSIIIGINGGYVIASNQTGVTGSQTIYLTNIGATGALGWRQSYFTNDSTSIEKVIATSNNEYLLIGNSTKFDGTVNNPSGNSDMVLIQVDNNGNFINSNQWGGVADDFGYDIIENIGENSFGVVGTTTSFITPGLLFQKSVLIAEFNSSSLNLKSKSVYGGLSNDIANDIEMLTDGYIICGESESNGNGAKDVYVLKTSFDIFNVIFEKNIGGTGTDIGYSVTSTSSGEYLIGGSTTSEGNGGSDGYLIKLDGSGNEVFSQTYGSTGEEKINSVVSLTDNKIIMLGTNDIGGNQMITLTKTKEDGTLN